MRTQRTTTCLIVLSGTHFFRIMLMPGGVTTNWGPLGPSATDNIAPSSGSKLSPPMECCLEPLSEEFDPPSIPDMKPPTLLAALLPLEEDEPRKFRCHLT